MNVIIFYLLAAVILVFSFLAVSSRRILRAATYLLFVLIATAGIYFLLQLNFLAAVQLMLYAGGITVLIVFSILLTSNIDHKFDAIPLKKRLASLLLTVFGAVLSIYTILQHNFVGSGLPQTDTSVRSFGLSFLNYGENGYILPFEVISILLLAALIGSVVVAKKK